MNLSKSTALYALTVIVLMVASALLIENSRTDRSAEGTDEQKVSPPALAVDATIVTMQPSRFRVELSATFEPLRSVVVGAEVSGRVIEVSVQKNEYVAAGAPLVRLDPALPEAAVERALASVQRALSVSTLAKTLHGRQQELAGKGIGSKSDFDATLSEAAGSDAAVAEARARLIEAKTLLSKTLIAAPFSGIVSELDLEPGAYVRTGDPVAGISDLSSIEINVGVDDRQIIALVPGSIVEVTANALPGESFEGVISSLGRTPDSKTRKYEVPVVVPNEGMRLLPGMLGQVQLLLGDETLSMRIPRSAIRREYELDYVYVLDPESGQAADHRSRAHVVRRQRVRVIPVPFRPDLVDVADGVMPGEMIATSNLRELFGGLRVQAGSVESEKVVGP